jgi:glycosyltransferase involved in cell wall biosynthesis
VSRPRIAHIASVDLTLRFLLFGQLTRLVQEGYDVTTISAPGPWVEQLRDAGIRHIAWRSASRSWDVRRDGRAFAELLGILRRERFDLVHTHNPKPGVMGRVAARLAGTPCVLNTVHGLYATPEDPLIKRAAVLSAEWFAARFSDLELYQSQEDLAWARRLHVAARDRSELLGNGVDLARFDPETVSVARIAELRQELAIPPGAPVIGTVGRMVAEKGYRELFAALEGVRREFPTARLLVVGQPDLDKADAIAPEDATGAGVVLAGWRTDVPALLALMDVFVLASWREGMPRAAIEAAAMARPLVLTNIRGCREVARDGVEGSLVPPRDPARLEAAILELLRDPELRNRKGEAARARAVERFDERRVAGAVADATRSLVSRARGETRTVDGVRLRQARRSDAPAMARLHRASMPEAFLPTLGDGVLRQLYRALGADRTASVLVAENHAGIVGFVAAVPSVRDFYRRFYLRRGIAVLVAAAPKLVRPSVVRRLIETARYPSATGSLPDAELLAIAVDGSARARGLGTALASDALADLRRRGVERIKVVVADDNAPANRLYERVGFGLATAVSVHGGRRSNVWVWASPS